MRLSQIMMEFLNSWQESLFGPNKNSPPGTPGYRWLLGLPGLAAHHLGHIEHSTSPFVKKYGLLLEMDAQGEILQSWHSPNGALPKVTTHIHIRRSRQMAFPIFMSAGKVQYFCHLPLLWVHNNKKEALNSVFL